MNEPRKSGSNGHGNRPGGTFSVATANCISTEFRPQFFSSILEGLRGERRTARGTLPPERMHP
jgi:hypothetical protein